MEEMQAQNGS